MTADDIMESLLEFRLREIDLTVRGNYKRSGRELTPLFWETYEIVFFLYCSCPSLFFLNKQPHIVKFFSIYVIGVFLCSCVKAFSCPDKVYHCTYCASRDLLWFGQFIYRALTFTFLMLTASFTTYFLKQFSFMCQW